eukprot:TRINITY_DN40535_c0_g1_i1.p1 TRINITY_DN40535_c0_g1~~TRINITY_DN40535_c0_g1_i1.p1  ORF type:complete len:539 (-),score=38.25 TRINITY_DN40535_c0_g1_i1:148-1764(-)
MVHWDETRVTWPNGRLLEVRSITPDEKRVQVTKSSKPYRGLFAKKDIPMGTKLFTEEALLFVEPCCPGGTCPESKPPEIWRKYSFIPRHVKNGFMDPDGFDQYQPPSSDQETMASFLIDNVWNDRVKSLNTFYKQKPGQFGCNLDVLTRLDQTIYYNRVISPWNDTFTSELMSTINHSCQPNCAMDLDAPVNKGTVYALMPIKAGEEITLNYLPWRAFYTLPTFHRRRLLLEYYNFICACPLCCGFDMMRRFPDRWCGNDTMVMDGTVVMLPEMYDICDAAIKDGRRCKCSGDNVLPWRCYKCGNGLDCRASRFVVTKKETLAWGLIKLVVKTMIHIVPDIDLPDLGQVKNQLLDLRNNVPWPKEHTLPPIMSLYIAILSNQAEEMAENARRFLEFAQEFYYQRPHMYSWIYPYAVRWLKAFKKAERLNDQLMIVRFWLSFCDPNDLTKWPLRVEIPDARHDEEPRAFHRDVADLKVKFERQGGYQLHKCDNPACYVYPVKPKTCSVCQTALYCMRACQKKHWSQHKKTCQPPPDIIE